MTEDVVLRRWIPRSAEKWAAVAVRLLMEAAVISKRIITGVTKRRRTNMMKIVHLPVIRTMEKKKATTRTMTKITTRTKRIMAIAPIPAMRKKKRTKVNMAAGAVAMVAAGKKIMTMTGAVPGALREDVALPVAAAHPAAVVLPGEDSPLWIVARNAASPAREDAPTMKKEAPMDMMKEAAVAAAAVPVCHPGAIRDPAPPAAATQVLPEEEGASHAIREDSSPAAADALAMAAGHEAAAAAPVEDKMITY
jgi:hypothetical protein